MEVRLYVWDAGQSTWIPYDGAGAGGGGTQFAEDAAHTSGATGTLALGVRQDADTSPVSATGDYHAPIFDALGNLKVNVKAGATAGTEYTEDAASAADPVGGAVILRRKDTLSASQVSADGDNIAANATSKGEIYVKHVDTIVVDGSAVTQPVSDGGTTLSVDDGAGSLTVDSAQLPTALVSGRLDVNVGATSIPTVIARSNKIADADGAQTNAALVTVAAGTRIVLTRLTVTVDEACTVGVGVRIGFGTATIAAASLAGTTDIILEHAGIVPGGGITIGDGSGVLALGDSDEDLRITCDDPVGGAIDVSYSYYTTT